MENGESLGAQLPCARCTIDAAGTPGTAEIENILDDTPNEGAVMTYEMASQSSSRVCRVGA